MALSRPVCWTPKLHPSVGADFGLFWMDTQEHLRAQTAEGACNGLPITVAFLTAATTRPISVTGFP